MLFGKNLFTLHKKTAESCKIYSMLRSVKKREKLSFHTPGHKLVGYDITELDFSDNLSCPNGCIKQAQDDVAKLLGAAASFFTTDGSTSGVLAMLYAAKQKGVRKFAVPYSSHKSVFNGCKLLGIEPVVFGKKFIENIPNTPTRDEMNENLEQADALFLTSPDYYGNVADLSYARAICEKQNKLLIVDGAHGGHLRFDKEMHAGAYAHLWVDGAHKSLPAFTQGSVVSAKTKELAMLLQEGVDIFRTTSPSYPIMASIEYAVKFPRNEELEKAVALFKKEYAPYIYQNQDYTKLCVVTGKDGANLQARLQTMGIYAEFFDGNVLMFYLSPATKMRAFEKLKRVLIKEFQTLPIQKIAQKNSVQQIPAPFVLKNEPKEWVDMEQAVGRVCAKTFGRFPPCIPCAFEGEIIDEKAIERVRSADNVFGIKNGKISVYQIRE